MKTEWLNKLQTEMTGERKAVISQTSVTKKSRNVTSYDYGESYHYKIHIPMMWEGWARTPQEVEHLKEQCLRAITKEVYGDVREELIDFATTLSSKHYIPHVGHGSSDKGY